MREHKREVLRISIAALLLAAVVITDRLTSLPRWAVLLLYAVPYLIAGGEVLLDAAKGILHGEWMDENFLMTVATLGAFAIGEYPEAVFVMLFFGIGELFEDIATDRSRRSVATLTAIRPDTAKLETPDGLCTVDPAEVAVGDIITVAAGERIPLDGTVVSGTAAIDTSALTGESLPAQVSEGDAVYSGTVDLNGMLRIRVTGTASESTVAKILELTQNAIDRKPKSERFITRFAKVYTPVVIGLAVLLTVLPGLITGRFAEWLYRGCLFLVVSCPCALVVSVPLGWFCGIGGAAGRGILVKGADTLERLSSVKTVVFDKTGTLTAGTFTVTEIHPNGCDAQTLLCSAALAEIFSSHPVAVSLRDCCTEELTPDRVTDTEEIAGHGVRALVDGKEVLVGNARLMCRFGEDPPSPATAGTVIHVRIAGIYAGYIVISDQPKPDSGVVVAALKRAGIRTVMLTGDREEVAAETAKKLGINGYRAELLPADKVKYMEEILATQHNGGAVAFVGDGINDAPALARADIGVAMGGLGADAAIEAADVVLMNDRIDSLRAAFTISRKTNRIVRQNIVFSIAIKSAILLLAAFGLTGMWVAAFADVGVLVIAVCNAIRPLIFKMKCK